MITMRRSEPRVRGPLDLTFVNRMKDGINHRSWVPKRICRILAALICFGVVFAGLSVVQDLTMQTRWALSGFVALAVLLFGPRVLAWIIPV